MTNDLISRSALLEKSIRVSEFDEGGWERVLRAVSVEDIEAAEAVDAAPVVHGRWIPAELHKSFGVLRGVKCSVCGEEKVGKGYNYCPNCGARMNKED